MTDSTTQETIAKAATETLEQVIKIKKLFHEIFLHEFAVFFLSFFSNHLCTNLVCDLPQKNYRKSQRPYKRLLKKLKRKNGVRRQRKKWSKLFRFKRKTLKNPLRLLQKRKLSQLNWKREKLRYFDIFFF